MMPMITQWSTVITCCTWYVVYTTWALPSSKPTEKSNLNNCVPTCITVQSWKYLFQKTWFLCYVSRPYNPLGLNVHDTLSSSRTHRTWHRYHSHRPSERKKNAKLTQMIGYTLSDCWVPSHRLHWLPITLFPPCFCFVSRFAALSICMSFLRPKILVHAVGRIERLFIVFLAASEFRV